MCQRELVSARSITYEQEPSCEPLLGGVGAVTRRRQGGLPDQEKDIPEEIGATPGERRRLPAWLLGRNSALPGSWTTVLKAETDVSIRAELPVIPSLPTIDTLTELPSGRLTSRHMRHETGK